MKETLNSRFGQIVEIDAGKLPSVLISDSHCNLKNIRSIKSLYPYNQMISLGDITSLWAKKEEFNERSVKFFMENQIPTLMSNHEEHIINCLAPSREYTYKVLSRFDEHGKIFDNYVLSPESLAYLQKLPIGFKINLKNGKHYLLFHMTPLNLWGFINKDDYSTEDFLKAYPVNKDTVAVVHGHCHTTFIKNYKGIDTKRISIGAAKDGEYAILDENGVHFKKL